MFGRDDLENFNHLVNGVLLLGVGLVSSAATEAEAKRTRRHRVLAGASADRSRGTAGNGRRGGRRRGATGASESPRAGDAALAA